jgi:hypothetical protein
MNGKEPNGDSINFENANYTINLMRALNWYSYEKSKKDAFKFLRDYVKQKMPSELSDFDKIDENKVINSYGWVARLILRNAKFSDKHTTGFMNHIQDLLDMKVIEKESKPQVVVTAPRPTIQDAIKEKASEFIGELEGRIDEFIETGNDINLYNELKSNQIAQPYVPHIDVWAKKRLAELLDALTGKDEQLVEGYSNFDKRKLKAYAKLVGSFIEDCDKYSQFKKANRKPRVRKPKAPGLQVKNLKYKAKDDELGLSSVSPTEIVGALQVWVFNTKTRKLAVYRTESTSGMEVKGTSIQNYEPAISEQKTLRKPDEQLKALMSAGKVQLRKFMETVKSKKADVNGRLSVDTIILKAIR